jgi:hypothetical protein
MSAEVEAVGFIVGLGILAAGVILPALPAASRRVKAMAQNQRDRQEQATAILSMRSVSPSRTDRTGADVAPNWHSDEHPVLPGDAVQAWAIQRPAGDTQEWLAQERVAEVERAEQEPAQGEPDWIPAEVVEEEPEPDDTTELLADEPTPLFDAAGPFPEFRQMESFTASWNRTRLIEEIRKAELDMARRGEQAA